MARPQQRDLRLVDAVKSWKQSSPITIDDMLAFGMLIGHPHNPHAKNNKIIDTDNPEVNRIVDLILSENGHTILKMLEVKYNDKSW